MQREQIFDYDSAQFPDARPSRLGGSGGSALALFLVGAYFVFTMAAIIALHLPRIGVTGQELSFRRTVFAAINATSLTGFQQDVGSTLVGADILRLVLTLGGTLFTLSTGGMAVTRIGRMRFSDFQIIMGAVVATAVATVGGAAFLLDADRGLLPSLLQSASAFGNSGLYAGRLPEVFDWRTHAVLLPIMFAGGLGIPVLMEVFDLITGGRKLSDHSRTVLILAAAFYLGGMLILALLEASSSQAGSIGQTGWRDTFAVASVFSIDARSTGLPFEFARELARPAQWFIVALMIVGGASGGTAGGIKTTTVWHLFTGVRDNLRGHHLTRPFGIAVSWVAVYFVIALAGFLLLLRTEPDMPADRLIFLAFSAASNVGLSHDPVSITGNGLFTLSGMMMAGRLAPIAVLWWMVDENDGETIAVG